MKYVGGAFDYWWLEHMMPNQAYEDVLIVMQAEGDAEETVKARLAVRNR